MRGIRVPAAALRLLRYLLPACVVAATCVAALGLLRVVSTPATEGVAQKAPALSLGSGREKAIGSAPPHVTSPSPHPRPTPTSTSTPSTSINVSVAVFNASGVSGLAGRTAIALRQQGIDVALIGNLSAARRPAAGTVYYPPGIRAQALTLARLSGAPEISPAPEWLGAAGRLVLVLTSSEPAAEPVAAHAP